MLETQLPFEERSPCFYHLYIVIKTFLLLLFFIFPSFSFFLQSRFYLVRVLTLNSTNISRSRVPAGKTVFNLSVYFAAIFSMFFMHDFLKTLIFLTIFMHDSSKTLTGWVQVFEAGGGGTIQLLGSNPSCVQTLNIIIR